MALAFADFIDLKSPYTAAHSRRVAGVTAEVARLMRCEESHVARFRQPALMHDVGSVALPSQVLNTKEHARTTSGCELVRLHPYYGERILERVAMMAPFSPLVGNHHEQVDGGFFRGLKGSDIPLGSRKTTS